MDDVRIPPAGDPFTAKKPETDQRQRLARLEDRYRHEIMDDDERQRLRDEILRLRRREERWAGEGCQAEGVRSAAQTPR